MEAVGVGGEAWEAARGAVHLAAGTQALLSGLPALSHRRLEACIPSRVSFATSHLYLCGHNVLRGQERNSHDKVWDTYYTYCLKRRNTPRLSRLQGDLRPELAVIQAAGVGSNASSLLCADAVRQRQKRH